MKNNIDYYRHSAVSDQHPKFKMLRNRYGWEGEGKFWALNNRIAQAENCCLNISKKYNKASIANDLDFKTEEFEEFIEFLINECELLDQTEDGLTTDTVQENFQNVSEKRRINKIGYQNRHKIELSETLSDSDPDDSGDQNSESEIQQSENIQSKVKESKVKEIKGKKNPPPEIVSFVLDDLNKRLGLKRGFSCWTKKTQDLILSKVKEGFTLQDIILVNEKKVNQWKDDSEMSSYLRPETLYGNKFEGYLLERVVKVVNPKPPKYQTADERRRENNKKVFEQTLQEIDDVHRPRTEGGGISVAEAESDHGFLTQLRRELPQGNN